MIEVYSNNITAAANAAVPFNSTALKKGHTVEVTGSTIQFNSCGIYIVYVNASVSGTAGATVSLQLRKDGVLQPQAHTSVTVSEADTVYPLGFVTAVQVPQSNACNVCVSPTVCEVVNTGAEADLAHIGLVVTKLV